MFDDTVTGTESRPAKRFADMTYEERKRECAVLEKRLWALRDEAHRKGMRFLSQEEFDEIWAEERAFAVKKQTAKAHKAQKNIP